MTTYSDYWQGKQELPSTYLSWDLFGAGLESFGKDGKPVELPLREPNDDEILLRVDAIGLCFSDTKLINAGPEHPRITGRDLEKDPTVPGHEAAMTVMKVGAQWKEKFAPGERYAIQADIFINGEQKAFGYVQRGAMAQYVYAGPMVLDGDDGCYLLPLADKTGYAEAALVEPWACVEAAYVIPQRLKGLDGGRLIIVAAEGAQTVDIAGLYEKKPAEAMIAGTPDIVGCNCDGCCAPTKIEATPEAIAEAAGKVGFDDIILLGNPDTELMQACDRALAKDGILCLIGNAPEAMIDIGRVHYHGTRHVGATSGKPADLYANNQRTEIKPGGATWFIGAAGPMGQMHVQRALELPNPPEKILCSDVSPERMAYMETRLGPLAKERGITMLCVDPTKVDNFDEIVADFAEGKGYDDVVVLAPVAKLVEHATRFMGVDSVMNIFAGVAIGTMASMKMQTVTDNHARYLGSSGSALEVMLATLKKTEAGNLSTNYSLAALGSIEAAWKGIKGVKEGTYPGKTVLYPHITDLPLTTPEMLKDACPEAFEKLGTGGVWTNEAEKALLESMLK